MALEFEFQDEGLIESLKNLPQNAQDAVVKTVREITERGKKIVKFKTPVDSGKAIKGWRVRFEEGGSRGVFFNDVPYINVLEFGGYPVIPNSKGRPNATGSGFVPEKSKATLGGYPPAKRTQIAPGGSPNMRSNVSKQAPRGMVRSTLEELEPQFIFDLSENLDKALS